MLFAIDIDGTVAGSPPHVLISYMSQKLGFHVPATHLAAFSSYRDFLRSPEVRTWLAQSDEHQTCYDQALYQAQFDIGVQKQSIALPGAVEATQALALLGRIMYLTLRKPESEQLTRDWLAVHGFPSPTDVFSCEHYQYKYLEAHRHADVDEYVMIIDDNYRPLLARFKTFFDEYRDIANSLRKRLAVVAYGAKEPPRWPFQKPAQPLFDIAALPSWTDPGFWTLYHQIQEALPHEFVGRRI